jgi:hypothetical protein
MADENKAPGSWFTQLRRVDVLSGNRFQSPPPHNLARECTYEEQGT